MTRSRIFVPAAILGLVLAGCAADITKPPYPPVPPLIAEQQPLPPVSPDPVVWQPGHWDWNGATYAWVPGMWVPRAGHGTLWQPGYWSQVNGTYVWVPGHWV